MKQLSQDPKLWRRIDLAAEAGRALAVDADLLAQGLLDARATGVAPAYSEVKYLRDQLGTISGVIFGEAQDLSRGLESSRYNQVAWTLLRAAIADQFSRFSFRDESAICILKEIAFEPGSRDSPVPNAQFWSLSTDNRNPARLWFILAYLNLLDDEGEGKEFRRAAAQLVKDQLPAFFDGLRDGPLARGGFGSLLSVDAVRWCAVYRLARNSIRDVSVQEEEEYGDEFLFAQLQQRLGGHKQAGVEVSLLLRALRGRYVTGMPSCPSWWAKQFNAAVRHVLESQGEADGQWTVPGFMLSPLMHEYSPLRHVLDLPMDVVRDHAEQLAIAAERSTASARARLDQAKEVRERFRLEPHKVDLESGGVFSSIWAAASLGDIIYDRFRDLLSELILSELGAAEVSPKHKWDQMTETLGFKRALMSGVVERWRERSARRPGAILVFGPPGTGKTTCAQILACALQEQQRSKAPDSRWRLLALTPADFARQGSDGVVAQAERIFGLLRQVRRCVVLMDEMEEFLRARSAGTDRESRLVTTAFLPLLQEVVSSREIILMVATNFVGRIDPAITRQGRFDLILPLGPPNDVSRGKLFNEWSTEKGNPLAALKEEVERRRESEGTLAWDTIRAEVVRYTMGYSPGEMSGFVQALAERGMKWSCSASEFRKQLWRLRSENVPMALSNRAGCSWPVFADEVRRYSRPQIDPEAMREQGEEHYWDEPQLPLRNGRA